MRSFHQTCVCERVCMGIPGFPKPNNLQSQFLEQRQHKFWGLSYQLRVQTFLRKLFALHFTPRPRGFYSSE